MPGFLEPKFQQNAKSRSFRDGLLNPESSPEIGTPAVKGGSLPVIRDPADAVQQLRRDQQ